MKNIMSEAVTLVIRKFNSSMSFTSESNNHINNGAGVVGEGGI